MKGFEDYHPLVQFFYFMALGVIAACFVHPVTVVLSLFGAVCFFLIRNGKRGAVTHLYSLLLLLAITLINPLFRHHGATVLLIVNHNPVTLESILYGVCSGAMLVGVLYWFRSMSQIMSADRLLYLFGRVSPRLGLIVSMALRYVPLFMRQARKVGTVQRMLYVEKEDNLIDKSRGAARTLSVMTSWALEQGVVTADSMAARGYATGRRTQYHLFRFGRSDAILLAATAALSAAIVIGALAGGLDISWYPYITLSPVGAASTVCYGAYAMLVVLPTALEIGGKIRWKHLQSKI